MKPITQEYELTVLYPTGTTLLQKEQVEEYIRKYFIIGEIVDEGEKRLAYKIDNQSTANYFFYKLLSRDGSSPSYLSSQLNICDAVLRYLLVTVDKNKMKFGKTEFDKLNNNITSIKEKQDGTTISINN